MARKLTVDEAVTSYTRRMSASTMDEITRLLRLAANRVEAGEYTGTLHAARR